MYHPANHSFYAIPTFTMARSFLPILLLALAGAAAGFFEAVAPHQEVTVPNKSFAANPEARGRFFDTGLDNPDVVSDMKITPSRKCGFCMGVSEFSLNSSYTRMYYFSFLVASWT
jgi:hypothetical protein